MPGVRQHRPAVIPRDTDTAVGSLQKPVAVVAGGRVGIVEGGPARLQQGAFGKHDVHDQGVLVGIISSAIWGKTGKKPKEGTSAIEGYLGFLAADVGILEEHLRLIQGRVERKRGYRYQVGPSR